MTTLDQPAAHYGLGLTIGNANVRLLELVNAYAALARLGEFRPYRLLENDPIIAAKPIADQGASYLIADILNDNAARTLSFGSDSWLRFDFPVAVKTGTSTSFRDNWAIGYTPEFTAGVWVGNFDGHAMHNISGVSGAAPILHQVFTRLHQEFGTTWYAQPIGVIEQSIHSITGKLITANLPAATREKFLRGTLPEKESPNDYDANGRIKLGTEYRDWLAGNASYSLGQFTCPNLETRQLSVVSPLPGTVYYLDPDLPQSDELPLKTNAAGSLAWESPSLQCVARAGETVVHLREGRHQIILRDLRTGARADTWIVVKAL
jgi:penicillin-binding protein 1C